MQNQAVRAASRLSPPPHRHHPVAYSRQQHLPVAWNTVSIGYCYENCLTMLLLDYHNVLIQSLLTERFSEYDPSYYARGTS